MATQPYNAKCNYILVDFPSFHITYLTIQCNACTENVIKILCVYISVLKLNEKLSVDKILSDKVQQNTLKSIIFRLLIFVYLQALTKIFSMENSLQLPQPQIRPRAHSCNDIHRVELDIRIIQQNRWVSCADLQHEDQGNSCCTLKLFYKITDIVLVICAVVFTVSSIASTILWICGL